MFAPVPSLLAAALLRAIFGSRARFQQRLRAPATLAKEIATMGLLCGGRIEFGLGAGFNTPECNAIGINFDPAAVRMGRADRGCSGH